MGQKIIAFMVIGRTYIFLYNRNVLEFFSKTILFAYSEREGSRFERST